MFRLKKKVPEKIIDFKHFQKKVDFPKNIFFNILSNYMNAPIASLLYSSKRKYRISVTTFPGRRFDD